uniref:Uncharacterized protein n=1 Tax=Laticauda laticaudata TaxID=8630 RepID=A0A8C5SSD8_LATLA
MRTYHCFWFLFWFGSLHQSYSIPLSKKTTGFPKNPNVLDLSQNSRKELSRSKRSWMWNQFFLLEEYTGSDYQYVGKVGYFISFLTGKVAWDIMPLHQPSLINVSWGRDISSESTMGIIQELN